MSDDMRILGICGSLRKASLNAAALRAAQQLAPAGMVIESYDLASIPLYHGDVEAAGLPAAVTDLRARIAAADGLLVVTPEYNFSIPGVLKNAIDWASRPPAGQPFSGKPAAIMGASAGLLGTGRSQYHLRQVLVALNTLLLNRPEVFIGAASAKFDADGNLTDAGTRDAIAAMLVGLRDWVERLRR